MNLKNIILEGLLMVCFPAMLWAQEAKIRSEKMEELFKMLRPADRKILVEGHVEAMTSAFFSEEEKKQIDNTFQELQGLRVAVSPELRNFIECVNGFFRRNEKANFQVWMAAMDEVLSVSERKRQAVRDFLEMTAPVAAGQFLFRGSSHQWLVYGPMIWREGKPLRVEFQQGDLVCRTRKDSIFIKGTSGSWMLGTDNLDAVGGKVDWNREGDERYAELSSFRIVLSSSGYTADSVFFNYPSRYSRPLSGKLRDNALKYERGKGVPFPEFVSYDFNIYIPDLYPAISYCGGVSYAGDKFSGVGTEEHPATLKIAPNDTISMSLLAKQFAFDSLLVRSGQAEMVIQLDSGEITHTDINFAYALPRNTVTVKRISEQSLHLPFKDTYHCILFDMEEIIWPLDSTYMEMRMSNRSGLFKATIESLNYFSDNLYDNLQGLDEVNPLNGLLKCSMERGTETFTIAEYAEYLKKPADQLRKQIILLSYNDFVDYNENRDEVTLKPRLFDYTKARVGKQDYDNIRFFSLPEKSRTNARLDVRNFNLRILGVEKFVISESRNISVEPSDLQVVMLKNRDMEFNGKLKAGMFDMFGKNLFFSYDRYTIDLAKVDSTSMYLAGKNKHLRGEKIKSLIRDITGEIVIDKPDNKSGKKEEEGFPVLNSTKESYVYFDDPAIQEGKYKRDSFYYVIKPYTIKGINDAGKFRYAFDGTLISHIVSPIEDTLRLMPDHALGLSYRTPETGIELYGQGTITERVRLDRRGFVADGRVELNKAGFQSDSILMLPQLMMAQTPEVKIDSIPGVRPEAYGKEVQIAYLPAEGNLKVTSTATPFDVYGGRVKHTGTLFVYDDNMNASGKLELEGASLSSDLFRLCADDIHSEKTALNIASILNKNIQLNTSNVKADIDLVANKGEFVNNTASNHVEFTSCRYRCSFESFIWYMKEAYLNIGLEDPVVLEKLWKVEVPEQLPNQGRNVFVSTDRLTDSLTFVAPQARYDLKNGDIACHWVNHIDVANGRFYPGKGDVFIDATGHIRDFTAGRLLCERQDSLKVLTEVDLKLKGKYHFEGAGNFLYVSEENKKSPVRFTELGVDTSRLIMAGAVLTEEKPLLLNDGLVFKGKVTLFSRKPHLFFAGAVDLTADKAYLKHTWLAVNDFLDERSIRIPVQTESRNDKYQRIYNGMFLNTDKAFKPYAAFMSNRLFYKDDLLIGGSGKLEWSAPLKQYIISDTLADRHYRFRYDTETGVVSAYGPLDLNLNMPGVVQRMAGDISYHLQTEKLKMEDVLCLLDFSILGKMEVVLLKDFADKKLKTIQLDGGLQEKIYEVYGKTAMPAIEKQYGKVAYHVPDSLSKMFMLDSLEFTWNAQTRSYVSNGQVRIVAVKGRPVERVMNIKLEILRSRSEDQFFMYIFDDQMWYYFEYSDQSLYTLSSNEEYNTVVKLEKADKKVVWNKEKEILYTITLCPESKKERFLKRIK